MASGNQPFGKRVSIDSHESEGEIGNWRLPKITTLSQSPPSPAKGEWESFELGPNKYRIRVLEEVYVGVLQEL
jgi:hypothetical protein